LRENYRKIATQFGYRLIKLVDKKKELSENEEIEMLVDGAIAVAILKLSEKRAKLILDTTKDNLKEDVKQVIAKSASEGVKLTQGEIAEEIRKKFVDNGLSRSSTISQTETLMMSETAKQIELNTLSENDSTINNLPIDEALDKTWVAVLDNQTRPEHAFADGQSVDINESFDVGGEELEYPGDPNGSAGNIINCRCNMVISPK
jgi:hypothetical protein